jgi:hypothetical protein
LEKIKISCGALGNNIEFCPKRGGKIGITRLVTKDEQQHLHELAEICRRTASEHLNRDLEYNLRSLNELDDIIEAAWNNQRGPGSEQILDSAGAYFGETLLKTYGGEWIRSEEHGYGIKTRNGMFFPFARIQDKCLYSHSSLKSWVRAVERNFERPSGF